MQIGEALGGIIHLIVGFPAHFFLRWGGGRDALLLLWHRDLNLNGRRRQREARLLWVGSREELVRDALLLLLLQRMDAPQLALCWQLQLLMRLLKLLCFEGWAWRRCLLLLGMGLSLEWWL